MIRSAVTADLAVVQSISAKAYAAYEPIIGTVPLPGTENYAPRIARGEVYLLEVSTQTAGLIVLEREPDHVLVYSIAIAPDFQGQGHASTMLRFAERQTRDWGLSEIRLYTNTRMEPNIAIYKRAGYRETGRRQHPTRPHLTLIDMTMAISRD